MSALGRRPLPLTGYGSNARGLQNRADALFDVLRLSRGMTLKNAGAGLKLGGGKAVIIGDPKRLKSDAFFHVYAGFINSLNGKYYTAEDVNISDADIAVMRRTTPFVSGTPDVSGNPSPFTARGVYRGMKAGASVLFGSDSLSGRTIVVQGVGSVGYALCAYLKAEGAKLKVYDINPRALEKAAAEFSADILAADAVLTTPCDIFAPCAMGAVLNRQNIDSLRCFMIAGAANNVLRDAATGDALSDKGVLYLPDYIVNAGGVINCGMEVAEGRYDVNEVNAKVDAIYETTLKIIRLSKERHVSTYQAAEEYAMSVLNAR